MGSRSVERLSTKGRHRDNCVSDNSACRLFFFLLQATAYSVTLAGILPHERCHRPA